MVEMTTVLIFTAIVQAIVGITGMSIAANAAGRRNEPETPEPPKAVPSPLPVVQQHCRLLLSNVLTAVSRGEGLANNLKNVATTLNHEQQELAVDWLEVVDNIKMFLSTRQYQEMTLADIQSMQNATNRLLFIYQRIITAFPAAPALYLLRFQTAFNRTNPIVTANTPIALVSTQYGLLLRVDRSNPGAWTVRADGTTIYGNMRFTMSPAIGGAANLTDGIKYGAAIFIKLKDTCMRLSKRDVGAENVQVSGNESWREQFKVEPAFSGAVNDGYVRVGDTVRLRCEFKSQGESASRWIRARAKTDGTVDALFDFDVLGSTWTIVGESGQFALPF